MPYAAPSFQDMDDDKKQNPGQGVSVSGDTSSFSTGVPGQDASSGGKDQNGSGDKFANIQSYLDVNKDQGNQMGQKIQGDITQNAETAKTDVNSLASKAPQVQAYDPNAAYNNVLNLSDADKQQYNTAKAGYKGPQTVDQVDGYGDTQKAVSKASAQVQNAGSEQGQRQLLKDAYQRPSYTGGENALDQTIVQNSPDAKKGYEDLRQKYSGLSSMFDNTAQDVGSKINTSIGNGLANQQAIAKGEAQVVPGLLNPIQQRASDQNKYNQSVIGSLNNDIGHDTMSGDTISRLGLNDGQNLYDLNLSKYLNVDGTQVGVNNAATADERAKYAALTNLIDGKNGDAITSDGKAINPYTFNKDQFDKDFAAKDSNAKTAKQRADETDQAAWNYYNDMGGNDDPNTSMYAANMSMNGGQNMRYFQQLSAARDQAKRDYEAMNPDRKLVKG